MDVIDELRALGTTAPPSTATLDATRAAILEMAHDAPQRHRRWLQHRVLMSAAAMALVGGSSAVVAAAFARTTNPTTMTTIECGIDTYIPAETGNPVLDCYNALEEQGGTVPPLMGWVTPTGLVQVLPTGEHPAVGSTPLPPGFQVDAGVRYITASLGDATGPLLSTCTAPSVARAYAEGQLFVAGLTGWHVRVNAQSGTSACSSYAAVIEPRSTTIELQSTPSSPSGDSGNVTIRLDDRLHAQMVSGPDAACLSTSSAEAIASRDAVSLGIASDTIIISDAGSVGTGPTCATPFVEPAGNVDVVLWQTPRS